MYVNFFIRTCIQLNYLGWIIYVNFVNVGNEGNALMLQLCLHVFVLSDKFEGDRGSSNRYQVPGVSFTYFNTIHS